MAQEIWDAYLQCDIQKLAYNSIIIELLKGELNWVRAQNNKTTIITEWEDKPLVIDEIWPLFIREFILHLHLFGYVLYRLQKKGKKIWYEVADPTTYTLERRPQSSVWSVRAVEMLDINPVHKTKDWHLTLYSPPLLLPRETRAYTQYTSCGHRSLEYTRELQRIREEAKLRDKYNSIPTVFTQVSKQIAAASDGKRPWFRTAAMPMYDSITAPDVPQDFNTLVEERAETLIRLQDISEQRRQRAEQAYDADMPVYSVGAGKRPKRRREHRELMVTDGQESQSAPFLRAPEGIDKIIQKNEQHILFAWGVPPQVLGQNINTERTAASNRLSDIAISGFEANIKIIRQHLQDALCRLSTHISGDSSVYIRLASCMSTYNLSQLEGILTPQACLETYSCVYQVPLEHIDLDAIKARQATLNNTAAAQTRVEQKSTLAIGQGGTAAEGTSKKNRPTMTEQQKDQRAIAKSKQPSA